MTFRKILLALAALFLLTAQPAFAAQQVLCSPENPLSAQNRRVVVTSSTAATQPVYTLNGQGCAVVAQADVGFFLAQGYSPGTNEFVTLFTTGVQTGTTDIVIATIPAGAFIKNILFSNSVASAVTGGISIGTTANGTDVVAAQTCGASCLTFTTDALLLKRPFSLTAATQLHAAAVTAWNSTNVTFTVIYGYF